MLYEALQALEDIVDVNEGHFEVDLCEFRLTVSAEILVAEAARELDISVHACDHQQLLVHLRGLGQGVELAVVDTGRNDVVTRALGGGLDHHRGFDLGGAVCVEVLAGCLCDLVTHHEVPLERLAAQVEVAVLQAELLVGLGVAYYFKRRSLRLGKDTQFCYDYLHAAGLYLGVDALAGAYSALCEEDVFGADALCLFKNALLGVLVEHELNDARLIS